MRSGELGVLGSGELGVLGRVGGCVGMRKRV